MPKRSRKTKPPSADPNVAAFEAVARLTGRRPKRRKNPAAVALGRKGGRIGGKRRAENMTAEERSESARKAVLARWAKRA
ncbi:MAG: hypothetical protein HOP28_08830 [Gemmatimonadales bacterium]|nr:hypothetical protein [Gemmatimonadales bacterium]